MNALAEQPVIAPPPTPPPVVIEPPYSLPRIFLGLIFVVVVFDVCFWRVNSMGFSMAVFVPLLAGAILANRENPWRRSTLVISALLAGVCGMAVVETDIMNTIVLLVLVLALAGDSFYDGSDAAWTRWYSQLLAMVFAPGRVFWLVARMIETGFSDGAGRGMNMVRRVLLAIPALVLALVFGSLLATGNAVFGTWTGDFFNWAWKEFTNLFDIGRIVVWVTVAFVALPLLRPGRFSAFWWRWMANVPRLPEIVSAPGAVFSSMLVLVVLNVLFAMANVADAIFLWSGMRLPAGVTYSGYVHNGVNALTVTVLLSALVLAGIFQQQLGVAGRRGLKALGLVWIAQNLFVLISVVLRLKLYIEAYDMSVLRLSVIIFLLLVAAGYGLLAIKIVREKSLPWLVGGCALAIFATFYVAQFLNLAGWSADYNVARWEKDPTRTLDVSYLVTLGPSAWPALARATNEGATWNENGMDVTVMQWLRNTEAAMWQTQFNAVHWREFGLRAWWNQNALNEGR